jgi:GntR family transcriptional regulator/MocR family aminotransferase
MVKAAKGALLATLEIDRNSDVPIYRQIEDFLRQMILNGALLPSQKLPSTRELALELGVSRITIKSVYEQLISEGYVKGKTGAGTFVSKGLDSETPIVPSVDAEKNDDFDRNFSQTVEQISLSKASARYGSILPFRPGVPALDKFPIKRWNKYLSRATTKSDITNFSYGDLLGSKKLRSSIAHHLADSRGMKVDPKQILITSGAQQAFVLISYVLMNKNDTVWYENPGHIAGRDLMKIVGGDVSPIPIDSEGLSLPFAILNFPKPKLIFTTPSHQQPLGITMSLQRRLALLKYAHENASWVIEDDYDSEFRYRGRPLPALAALDKVGRVLYVGTFSKSLFPSVRIGYVVVPEALMDAFAKMRNIFGQTSSAITEEALSNFMDDGGFAEHIRKMRRLYRDRRDILLNALRENCSNILIPQQTDAGMHILADINKGISDRLAHLELLKSGIDSLPLSIYYEGPAQRQALVLGFSGVQKKVIPQLVSKMGAVLNSLNTDK